MYFSHDYLTIFVSVCGCDVGDDVDSPGKYPWQGSLQKYGSHICGGSLISTQWFLTAAHCVTASASTMTVVVGLHDMKQRFGTPERHSIKQIISHESYGSGAGSYPNDIALIQLSSSVSYNEHVQPIALAESDIFTGSSECVISGWGYMIEGRYFVIPDVLQEASTTILSESDCKGSWGSSSINSGHICLRNGQTGACMGDSGGPLACKNGASWELVGATSWGSGSCNVNMPSVYTKVSYFRDWVKATSGV